MSPTCPPSPDPGCAIVLLLLPQATGTGRRKSSRLVRFELKGAGAGENPCDALGPGSRFSAPGPGHGRARPSGFCLAHLEPQHTPHRARKERAASIYQEPSGTPTSLENKALWVHGQEGGPMSHASGQPAGFVQPTLQKGTQQTQDVTAKLVFRVLCPVLVPSASRQRGENTGIVENTSVVSHHPPRPGTQDCYAANLRSVI